MIRIFVDNEESTKMTIFNGIIILGGDIVSNLHGQRHDTSRAENARNMVTQAHNARIRRSVLNAAKTQVTADIPLTLTYWITQFAKAMTTTRDKSDAACIRAPTLPLRNQEQCP
jgi:hypothetical protein